MTTGYNGTGNVNVAVGSEMRETHIVIYEGLPTDKEVPIQISFASVLEAVIEQSK